MLTPFLGGIAFVCAFACAAIAIPTQFWTTSFDGTGSHIGLWELCWIVSTPGQGGLLTCYNLDWMNTQASFRAHGTFNESPDAAAAKWPVLLSARYCMIGAACVYLLAALTQAIRACCDHDDRRQRILLIVGAAAGLAACIANIAAIACFAFLSSKWSNYKLTELLLGPSLFIAIAAAIIAAATTTALVIHEAVRAMYPQGVRLCCGTLYAKPRDAAKMFS